MSRIDSSPRGVERSAGTVVDAVPGLAVGTEPQPGAHLPPGVLAARHQGPGLVGGNVEGPLLVVAPHGLGGAERPALVVARGPVAPDGGVGLGLVAHPAHGQQVAVGVALPGRHDLADALVGRFHVGPLPAAAVVRRPRGGHRGAGLGVEHRSQDEPRLAVGGGRQQVGHVGHRLLVGDGRPRRPLEGGIRRRRRRRWNCRRRRLRPGPIHWLPRTTASPWSCAPCFPLLLLRSRPLGLRRRVLRSRRSAPGRSGPGPRRVVRPRELPDGGRSGRCCGRSPLAAGCRGSWRARRTSGRRSSACRAPQSPSRCSILVAGECPVQSNRHVPGSEAPR